MLNVGNITGATWWSAEKHCQLTARSSRVPIPTKRLFVWGLHGLPMSGRVSARYSGFFPPQSKVVQVRLIGDFKLPVGKNVWMMSGLCNGLVLSPNVCRDRLQLLVTYNHKLWSTASDNKSLFFLFLCIEQEALLLWFSRALNLGAASNESGQWVREWRESQCTYPAENALSIAYLAVVIWHTYPLNCLKSMSLFRISWLVVVSQQQCIFYLRKNKKYLRKLYSQLLSMLLCIAKISIRTMSPRHPIKSNTFSRFCVVIKQTWLLKKKNKKKVIRARLTKKYIHAFPSYLWSINVKQCF